MRLSWQGDCSREQSTGCWLDSRDCPVDCSIERLLKVVERSESLLLLDSEDLRLLPFDVEKRPGSMMTFNALGCFRLLACRLAVRCLLSPCWAPLPYVSREEPLQLSLENSVVGGAGSCGGGGGGA